MARAGNTGSEERQNDMLFWLQFGVFALVILILIAVIWALMTTASIESGPPRSVYERQLRVLEAAVQQTPDDVEAWAQLIRIQAEGSQLQAAERAVISADDALGSRRGPIATESARIAYLKGEHETALEEVAAALVLLDQETQSEIDRLASVGVSQPPDQGTTVDAYLLKAEVLIAQDDLASAAEAYTAALAIKPTMANVFLERGRLYADLGQADNARADFQAALTFIPDYAPALEALADLER